jgi:hypothetical protein
MENEEMAQLGFQGLFYYQLVPMAGAEDVTS